MESIDQSLPMHVQMLRALRTGVEKRKRDLERRCGKGLDDREYQRHVGRVAECDIQLAAINEMMRADIEDISDAQEAEERESERSQRPAARNRASKRGAGAAADH